ncbi:MAG: selenium cofactor biosynthesis protein YqeC [Acidobacteria bacterium]|nr:selenium cofactor biosynthesis protein YqeC [Acidobacteriota bacterium]
MLTLIQALGFTGPSVAALVGAGGKTTVMFALARAAAPAIVTTTTHLVEDQSALGDRHATWDAGAPFASLALPGLADVTLVSGPRDVPAARLAGLTGPQWDELRGWCALHKRTLLVEADGSRLRPLKAPADHEPAIPAGVDTVIVVAGLSGLGQPLDDAHVHRAGRFARLSGLAPGDPVTLHALAAVLTAGDGGLKNIPAGARRVALLNQADTPELCHEGRRLAALLRPAFDRVVVTSLYAATVDAT